MGAMVTGVAVGDPVTVVGTFGLRRVKVLYVHLRGGRVHTGFQWDAGVAGHARADEEGVTWIRGHHEDDSLDALALIAAYKLRSQACRQWSRRRVRLDRY